MGQADIAYMIQRIYEKYNATQNDKKREERVYMREEEFKANLEDMVKKSPIEDKSLLYSEIYRNISEDALEVDSKGTITISLKVIIEAEKEIQKKEKTQIQESPKTEENTPINFISKEEYNQLSEGEKRDRFVQATKWVWDSPEEAEDAYDKLSKFTISADTAEVIKANDEFQAGEDIPRNTFERTTGIKYTDNKRYQGLILANDAKFAKMSEKTCFSMFFKVNGGQKELDMHMLESFLAILDPDVTPEQRQLRLNDFFEEGLLTEEQYNSVNLILSKKEIHENYRQLVKMLKEHATLKDIAKQISAANITQEQYDQLVAKMIGYYEIDTTVTFEQNLDMLINGIEQGRHIPKTDLIRFDDSLEDFRTTNQMVTTVINSVIPNLEAVSHEQYKKIGTYGPKKTGSVWEEEKSQYGAADTLRRGADKELASHASNIMGKNITTSKDASKTFGKEGDSIGKFVPKVEERHTSYDFSAVHNSVGENLDVKTLEELEASFDESLGAIGDDFMTAILGTDGVEMTVGSTEVEHDHDVEGDGEMVEDAPIGAAAASGLVAEDVVIGEVAPKVNEVQTPPVINESIAEVVEETEVPEQGNGQSNLPKVVTWADKIKQSLADLGKKAKEMFGKIAGMFGGGSNDTGNNTGTNGTGGIVQDAKPPKPSQAPAYDPLKQQFKLNYDYAKNASTEKGSDPSKPKGVDDPTQGHEMDDI